MIQNQGLIVDSQELIDQLIQAGIVPDGCTSFRLFARVGEVVKLEYTKAADRRVLMLPWDQMGISHEDFDPAYS